MARFGKDTRIKVVGGEVVFRYQNPEETEFARHLTQLEARINDWSPVFHQFLPYQLRSIDRNFVAQGRPRRWRALSPRTIADRRRRGFGSGPILQRTKKLRRSFKGAVSKRTLTITNTARARRGYRYFLAHQFGTRRIPRRVMIILLAQDRAQFSKLVKRYVQQV